MKYQIIYADPPWKFIGWSVNNSGRKAPSRHYEVQDLEWIKSLPVPCIADTDCALFLWVTYPTLEASFEVVKSWGFHYSTVAFTWVKTTKHGKWHYGLGYWTRANPELCLLATKGHPVRIDKSVPNLVVAQVGEHSRKPNEVRERIVQLMGDLPRIELFAREAPEGWHVWGNEVESDIDLSAPIEESGSFFKEI